MATDPLLPDWIKYIILPSNFSFNLINKTSLGQGCCIANKKQQQYMYSNKRFTIKSALGKFIIKTSNRVTSTPPKASEKPLRHCYNFILLLHCYNNITANGYEPSHWKQIKMYCCVNSGGKHSQREPELLWLGLRDCCWENLTTDDSSLLSEKIKNKKNGSTLSKRSQQNELIHALAVVGLKYVYIFLCRPPASG